MTGCRQICVSWKVDLNIFGWQLSLPPGVYPPGPPPGLIFPPGITLPGPLPPWPEITIGEDNVPTYTKSQLRVKPSRQLCSLQLHRSEYQQIAPRRLKFFPRAASS
ncbi:hypothetical protein BKA61DRAFT_572558 [Leptodontidium sp. MPI-SDFR-AT-0119]|nr:hypothetical protein BKA61DRAFT_572558 [Leptodontidium sp. MPI-SDFR-AT-0119]